MMHQKICKTCHRSFEASHRGRRFCSWQCAKYKAPAVYRFICPDGRSYVGAVADIRKRFDRGIARSNPWLDAAFKLDPPETWTYEILERLPPGCSIPRLREAEQRHIINEIRKVLCRDSQGKALGPVGAALDLMAEREP